MSMEPPPEGAFPTEIYCWTCGIARWFRDTAGEKLLCMVCGDPYRVQQGDGRIVEPNQPRRAELKPPRHDSERGQYGGM